MSSLEPARIGFSLTGFVERGGRTAPHVDGWGIAFYEDSGLRLFHDDQPAAHSPLAEFVRHCPIRSRLVLAHLRRATQGAPALANCHPFQREWRGQPWVFASNGDLGAHRPPLGGRFLPIGHTDSEHAFCWLMQGLHEAFADTQPLPDWAAMAPLLASRTEAAAAHGNFNLLLCNGQVMFVHCSSQLYLLERQAPFPVAALVDRDLQLDLSALNGPQDRMALVATQPLTRDEPWQALAPGEFLVLSGGRCVWRSRSLHTRARPPVATPCGRPLPAHLADSAG